MRSRTKFDSDHKNSEHTENSTSRVIRPVQKGRKRAPNMFEEMVIAANEKEQKKKQDDFQTFVASCACEFKYCDEVIVKPPAGEEFRLHCLKVGGQEVLLLSGGIGYEIFPELWTIRVPQKPHSERFDPKWTSSLVGYDFYAADRVAFYQASLTVFDDAGLAVVFGGMVKLGRGAGIEAPNDNAFLVDLNAMTGRLIKAKDEPGPGHLRLHCAGNIDGCLVVVGGLNSREEQSNQIWKLKVSRILSFSQGSHLLEKLPFKRGEQRQRW